MGGVEVQIRVGVRGFVKIKDRSGRLVWINFDRDTYVKEWQGFFEYFISKSYISGWNAVTKLMKPVRFLAVAVEIPKK